MKRNGMIMKTAAGLLCAAAVMLGGTPCVGQVAQARAEQVQEAQVREAQVRAADGDVGYTEQEIAAGISTNSMGDVPEDIPINTVCEGVVGGEYPDVRYNTTWTDWGDAYRVHIDQSDFTSTKRGRFHVELAIEEGSRNALYLTVEPEDGSLEVFYDGSDSREIITPSYSYYGSVLIWIRASDDEIPVRYRLKVVYDTLENNETGQWAETELNRTIGNAAELQVNQNYWGCLPGSLGTNVLYYKYTLDKPEKVSVSLKPQDGNKQLTEDLWQMYVYKDDEDGERYYSGTLASGMKSDIFSMEAGTHYIEVCTFTDFSVGQIYELRVNVEDTAQGVTGSQNGTGTAGNTGGVPQTPGGNTGGVSQASGGKDSGVESAEKQITKTKVTNATLKVISKRAVSIKWKKNNAAQGYKIYRSTKKTKGFKCIRTIANKNTTRWKDQKVRRGKTYYYKLRAYRKAGTKTYYSKYTKILRIRMK